MKANTTIVSAESIPNYKTGSLKYTRIGNIIFIQFNNLSFSDQKEGYVSHQISGFPPSTGGPVGSACMNVGRLNGEAWFVGSGVLEIRTLSTTGIFGYLCYPSE